MGVHNGHKFFGVNLTARVDLTECVRGKRVAFEAYGFLHELLEGHFRSDARASSLSAHLWGEQQFEADCLQVIVRNFVDEMAWFRHFAGGNDRFVVVCEGPPYEAKGRITATRKQNREMAHINGLHRDAVAIPDCAVKMILRALQMEVNRVSLGRAHAP